MQMVNLESAILKKNWQIFLRLTHLLNFFGTTVGLFFWEDSDGPKNLLYL